MSETNTAVATQPRQQFSLAPQNLTEAVKFAEMMAASDMVPKDYRGKPGNVLIAVQMGQEVGMQPMASIQNIAVINGKPGVYGDAGKAMLLANGCRIDEDDIRVIKANGFASCTITRGDQKLTRTYGIDNAKTAKLWGKEGPWSTNPERQMAWRAFWFAARDIASDILKGLGGAEELRDIPAERDITPGTQPTKKTATEVAQDARDTAAKAAGITPEAKAALVAELEKFSRTHTMESFVEHWKSLNQNVRAAIGISERDRITGLAGSDVIDAAQTNTSDAPTLKDALQAVRENDHDLALDIANTLSIEDQAKVKAAIQAQGE